MFLKLFGRFEIRRFFVIFLRAKGRNTACNS